MSFRVKSSPLLLSFFSHWRHWHFASGKLFSAIECKLLFLWFFSLEEHSPYHLLSRNWQRNKMQPTEKCTHNAANLWKSHIENQFFTLSALKIDSVVVTNSMNVSCSFSYTLLADRRGRVLCGWKEKSHISCRMKRNVRTTHLILLVFGVALVVVGGILALFWPGIFKIFLAKVSMVVSCNSICGFHCKFLFS